MKVLKIFEKILFVIFTVFVSITIISALYLNRQKFGAIDIARYEQIRVEEPARIEQIALNYTDPSLKDRFVRETEKINSLSSNDYISNRTLIIPVFE
ncbi:MAG: hypothetical protein ACQEP5_02340 [Actinomycetota bacterium]